MEAWYDSRMPGTKSLTVAAVLAGVFVGDRTFPEVVYVNVSRSYQAALQFIRQIDGKYPVNGIATSLCARAIKQSMGKLTMANGKSNDKSLESWIWDAACSIRGAKDAPKYKEFILPLIFTKRLCDVFDDEINRIAQEVGSRAKAFKLVKHDKKLVRFFLPLEPKNPADAVWCCR